MTRVETQVASGDNEFKFSQCSNRFGGLLGGETAVANEMAGLYSRYLREHDGDLRTEALLEPLYEPLRELRRRHADRYVEDRLSLSYEDFPRRGKADLPDDLFRTVAYEVASQEIRAEMILVGWVDHGFRILKVSGGRVFTCEPFAVIGSGGHIAEANLFQRGLDERWSVQKGLYAVYEAQRLGENGSGCRQETPFSGALV